MSVTWEHKAILLLIIFATVEIFVLFVIRPRKSMSEACKTKFGSFIVVYCGWSLLGFGVLAVLAFIIAAILDYYGCVA